MPFRSKQQMKACFASKGFNGKVDCHKWAHETPDTKSLPKKVKKNYGGMVDYNRKPKMQKGGSTPAKKKTVVFAEAPPTNESTYKLGDKNLPPGLQNLNKLFKEAEKESNAAGRDMYNLRTKNGKIERDEKNKLIKKFYPSAKYKEDMDVYYIPEYLRWAFEQNDTDALDRLKKIFPAEAFTDEGKKKLRTLSTMLNDDTFYKTKEYTANEKLFQERSSKANSLGQRLSTLRDSFYNETINPKLKNREQDFVKEANNLKTFYKRTNPNMDVEIHPIYKDDSTLVKNKLKTTSKNDDIVLMGHQGKMYAGLDRQWWADQLKGSNYNDFYLGSCHGEDCAEKEFRDTRNFNYRPKGPWWGVNPNASNLIDAMFSRVSLGKEFTGDPKIVKPIKDIDYGMRNIKKNYGGSIHYGRKKKCMNCGGKLQEGGFPRQQDFPDYESWQQAVDQFLASTGQQGVPKINIPRQAEITQNDFLPEEGMSTPSPERDLGVIEPRPVDDIDAEANRLYSEGDIQYQNTYDRDLGMSVLDNGTASERRNYRNFYRGKYGQGINPVDPFQVALGLKGVQTGLSWLSGIVDRRRQRRYMQNQYSTLGQNTPIPVSNFQPTPYNLYAKFGGNIKRYQFTNKAKNKNFPVDAGKMQQGGRTPIYTSNPNNPRLRAYQDSLFLYNSTKGMLKDIKTFESYYGDKNSKGSPELFSNQWSEYTKEWDDKYGQKAGEAFGRLRNYNNNSPSPVKKYESPIAPGNIAVQYKQPIQPVKYQRIPAAQLIPDEMDEMNLQLQGRTSPDVDVNKQLKTNYSFTYRTKDGQQKNMYFPDRSAFDSFMKDIPQTSLIKRSSTGNSASALAHYYEFKKGGWIQKATASIKRRGTAGKCTPISKPGCTGRAKALAKTFKKIARNRKNND